MEVRRGDLESKSKRLDRDCGRVVSRVSQENHHPSVGVLRFAAVIVREISAAAGGQTQRQPQDYNK